MLNGSVKHIAYLTCQIKIDLLIVSHMSKSSSGVEIMCFQSKLHFKDFPSKSQKDILDDGVGHCCMYIYVHIYVCLFWIRSICLMGLTPKGGPTESSPTTQATRHPRASLLFMYPIPPYLCHASCIRSVPPPPPPRPPVLYR